MEKDFGETKPLIRSILLALGKRATEKEFRSEYFNIEGESFNVVLRKFQMGFCEMMSRIPDVCRIWRIGNEVLVERVSNKDSSHMDQLTIIKKRKSRIDAGFRHGFWSKDNFNNWNRCPVYNTSNEWYEPFHHRSYFPNQYYQPSIKPFGSYYQNNEYSSAQLIVTSKKKEQPYEEKSPWSPIPPASNFNISKSSHETQTFEKSSAPDKFAFMDKPIISVKKTISSDEQQNSVHNITKSLSLELNLNDYITSKILIPQAIMKEINFSMVIPVEILELKPPMRFIFQFNRKSLDQLMAKMKIHYGTLEGSAHLRISRVFFGMTVAAFFKGEWHRAEVLFVGCFDALVLLVDYGNKTYVKIEDLRYLLKSFALPFRRAYEGSFFGEKQKKGEALLSPSVMLKFDTLIRDKKLSAIIKGEDDGIFKLILLITANQSSVPDLIFDQAPADVMRKTPSKSYILV